ncbi:MAG: arginine deiminase family protein [Pseudomonadota bacterium]
MATPLKRVLMRRPGPSLLGASADDWHYGADFDAERAISQYTVFAGLIEDSGAEVHWLRDEDDGLADAMFTHDPSLVTDDGAILLRMGKARREAEPSLHGRVYEALDIPILGRIEAPGQVEGGDCIWVDETMLAVGRGVRTNQAGIEQLQAMLEPKGVIVRGYDLPLWQGFGACLHLMSIMSPLAEKLALVHAPLFPVAFWRLLEERGYRLLEAPLDEFEQSNGLNLNVLPIRPSDLIMVDGFPKTKALMEAAGCTVSTFKADALCIACEGGPTCLTRPILRVTT